MTHRVLDICLLHLQSLLKRRSGLLRVQILDEAEELQQHRRCRILCRILTAEHEGLEALQPCRVDDEEMSIRRMIRTCLPQQTQGIAPWGAARGEVIVLAYTRGRAAPFVRAKAKFTVTFTICCKWKTRTYGVFDRGFGFGSHEWSHSKRGMDSDSPLTKRTIVDAFEGGFLRLLEYMFNDMLHPE